MSNQLSFVIVTSPNDSEVENAIKSAKDLGEIYLIDGGHRLDLNKPASDYQLIENLAKEYGCHYHRFTYEYSAKSYNFGIQQVDSGYIFILDSDEIIDDKLHDWLRLKKFTQNDVYAIKRINYFVGKPIKHGHLGPDWNIRLFKKDCAVYEDRKVHARMITNHKISKSPGLLLHFSNTSINSYFLKMIDYSSREVTAREKKSQSTEIKSKVRGIVERLPMQGFIKFVYSFLWKLGFLNGKLGFQLALTAAYYEILVSLKKDFK